MKNRYTNRHNMIAIAHVSRFAVVFTLLAFAVSSVTVFAQTPRTIKLEPYLGTALALRASVNGHEGLFLFDTGGGVSIVSPEFAKTVECKPWGRITGFRMTGERMDLPRCDNLQFKIDGTAFDAPTAGVVDLKELLPPDAPHLDGSIGLDIFVGRSVTFNEAGRTLTIETPESLKRRVRHATQIPIRIVRDSGGVALSVEVAVPTPEGTAWMELDSGNEGPFAIAKHMAATFHLDPEKKGVQPVKLTLAPGISAEGPARSSDLIMDGNIGAGFLAKWILTLDLATGRARLSEQHDRQ